MYASAPAGRKRPFGSHRRLNGGVRGFAATEANPALIEVEKDPHPCIPERSAMYIPPETRAHLEEVERRAGHLWKFLDVPGKQAAIARLEEQMGAATFWDSQKAAQKVIAECNGYKNTVAPQVAFRRKIDDAKTLAELIVESPDGTADAELEELRALAEALLVEVADIEIAAFLSGLHFFLHARPSQVHVRPSRPLRYVDQSAFRSLRGRSEWLTECHDHSHVRHGTLVQSTVRIGLVQCSTVHDHGNAAIAQMSFPHHGHSFQTADAQSLKTLECPLMG